MAPLLDTERFTLPRRGTESRLAPMGDRHPYLDGPYPRAYAHRGWHVGDLVGCENTRAAFVRAADEGMGYVELDVHASADGVPMVHHDPTLDRATDHTGRIDALPADAVAGARVDGREPVPRLAEVLRAVPRAAGDDRAEVRRRRRAGAGRAGRARRVGPRVPRRVRRVPAGHGPRAGRAAAVHVARRARACSGCAGGRGPGGAGGPPRWPVPCCRPCGARSPRSRLGFGPVTVVDRRFVRVAHERGYEVHVWTVEHPAEMHRLLDLGVDGLLSDRPDLLRDVVAARTVPSSARISSAPPLRSARDRHARLPGRRPTRGRVWAWGLWAGGPRRSRRSSSRSCSRCT